MFSLVMAQRYRWPVGVCIFVLLGVIVGLFGVRSSALECPELCVSSTASTFTPDQPNRYSFKILDQDTTIREFSETHTKLMHLIVVRKDLASFQHLHPEFHQATGQFTLDNLTFPSNGEYRLFADFAVNDSPVTLFEDVQVGSSYEPQPLGDEIRTKVFNDYSVEIVTDEPLAAKRTTNLVFTLEQNGQAVTDLDAYLGALGHAVIIREHTLDFIHVHPETLQQSSSGEVTFSTLFPEPGRYKIFTQFQHEGEVLLTDFVFSVEEGEIDETSASPHHH